MTTVSKADGRAEVTKMPLDKWGNSIPVLRTDFANCSNTNITTASTSEAQIHPGLGDCVYRFFAIGCAAYVVVGATGVAAASASNGAYIPQDSSIDMKVDKALNFMRCIAYSGSGILRAERLV